jgi:hypothetical protein
MCFGRNARKGFGQAHRYARRSSERPRIRDAAGWAGTNCAGMLRGENEGCGGEQGCGGGRRCEGMQGCIGGQDCEEGRGCGGGRDCEGGQGCGGEQGCLLEWCPGKHPAPLIRNINFCKKIF